MKVNLKVHVRVNLSFVQKKSLTTPLKGKDAEWPENKKIRGFKEQIKDRWLSNST